MFENEANKIKWKKITKYTNRKLKEIDTSKILLTEGNQAEHESLLNTSEPPKKFQPLVTDFQENYSYLIICTPITAICTGREKK